MSYLSGFPRAIVPGGVEMDLDAVATALPNLRLDPETLGEIRQALNSGKEVITHTDPVSVPGWQGVGYVITDMDTGAGAWKIGGGGNGSFLDNYPADIVSGILFMAAGIGALSIVPIAAYLAVILVAITVFHVFITFLKTDLYLKEQGCPEALGALHLALTVAFAALPVVWGKHLQGVLVSTFYSLMVDKSVNGVTGACRTS